MAPKSPRKDKKGKGKKKDKKKDPDALNYVNSKFCDLTITDLNRKLARLREHHASMEQRNVELKEELRELHYDRKDVAAHLTRELDSRNEAYEKLEEKHTELVRRRDEENADYEAKIKSLEDKYKALNNQLTSEIKLLTGKLNSLDEFRIERDALYARFEDAEDEFREQTKNSKAALHEMEQRSIVETNLLKKDIQFKLLTVSEDFTRSNEIRHAGYNRRIVRENIALQKEIDTMVAEQIKMKIEFNEYKFRNKEIFQNYRALEDTNLELMLRGQKQVRIIEKLTQKCERMNAAYIETLKYKTAYERASNINDCEKFHYANVTKKLREMAKRIELYKLDRNKMITLCEQQKGEINNLRSVICKLKHSIELVIGTAKEESIGSDYSYYMSEGGGVEEEMGEDRSNIRRTNRQCLLSELLVIVNSCQKPDQSDTESISRFSDSSLYHPGKIGFVAGPPKESLIDIIQQSAAHRDDSTSNKSEMPSSLDWQSAAYKIPTTCALDGNSVYDIEMGSTLYVSTSRDKFIVPQEHEEPLDIGEEGEGSSSDENVQPMSSASSDKPKPVEKKSSVQSLKADASKQAITDVAERLSEEEGASGEGEGEAGEEFDSDGEFDVNLFY